MYCSTYLYMCHRKDPVSKYLDIHGHIHGHIHDHNQLYIHVPDKVLRYPITLFADLCPLSSQWPAKTCKDLQASPCSTTYLKDHHPTSSTVCLVIPSYSLSLPPFLQRPSPTMVTVVNVAMCVTYRSPRNTARQIQRLSCYQLKI